MRESSEQMNLKNRFIMSIEDVKETKIDLEQSSKRVSN